MELFLQELAKLGDRFYLAFVAADRWKLYLSGLGNTLAITLGAICISTVLGMLLCLMKISRYRILRGPAKAYIDVIRGIPVVVQLMFIYFVVLVTWTNKTADKGQMEAGRSLGLTHGQTMWSIIFPQGIKNCLPTYASEFIVLVKETAVVGYIGMTDLTKAYSTVQSRTMDAMPPLIIIAVVYFCITKVLSVIFAKMERRLRESDRR